MIFVTAAMMMMLLMLLVMDGCHDDLTKPKVAILE